MALIVEQHVIADMYPVGETAISAGMLVAMNPGGTGVVIPATTALLSSVIGVAGDTYSPTNAAAQTTAYSAQVVIGASDADTARTRWTSNRISDMYNETAASGKITVYNGGGKFWISQDLVTNVVSMRPGDALIADDGGMWEEVTEAAGTLANSIVGLCVGAPQQYPSGVPGTDTPDGSIALGNAHANNLWMPVSLRI